MILNFLQSESKKLLQSVIAAFSCPSAGLPHPSLMTALARAVLVFIQLCNETVEGAELNDDSLGTAYRTESQKN